MKDGNRILRIIALFSLFLLVALIADAQMNRDSPFLGSKIPKTSDESVFTQTKMSASSFAISEPFNGQASSDLTLSADAKNTTCLQAAFLITMTPISPQTGAVGYQSVKARVLDNSFGSPKAVAELILLVPAQGGSVRETIGFFGENMPKGLNRTSEITVVVDPDNEIKESDEGDNILIMKSTCND
jgi:hypothetical protein